jgi:hypothetical protein
VLSTHLRRKNDWFWRTQKTILLIGDIDIGRGPVLRELTIINNPKTDNGVRPPYPMLDVEQIKNIFRIIKTKNEEDTLKKLKNNNIVIIFIEAGLHKEEFVKKIRAVLPKYRNVPIYVQNPKFYRSGGEVFCMPDSAYV